VADTKTPRARSLAIEGLNLISDSSVLAVGYWEALIEWMKDPEAFHGTRVEAAKALARWEDYHAVAALMEQLDDPLLREPVRDGLTRLTGQEFWGSRYSWKEWWKEQQGDYTPEPMDPEAFEAFEAEREKEAKENSSLEFFGVEITGKNILFVLDCSGSMWYEERITRLKDELNAMIGSLDPSYQFGLLLFPEASVPGKDFDEASDRYRERVQDFVNQMTADGETPMAAALHHAYKRIVSRENVDTIYLLSDGVPSDVTPEILLNEVAGYFEEFGTTIHTVFIGDDLEGQLLMDQVATVTGGRFVHVP
ncbi:MAG: vWA domain-containing protein, partial [Verrucomicrobiota bacterium]